MSHHSFKLTVPDGDLNKTEVTLDGVRVRGLIAVQVDGIRVGCLPTITLTMYAKDLEIEADFDHIIERKLSSDPPRG